MLETKIAAAMKRKQDNAQNSAIDATTVDKFHERGRAITDATLQVTVAYDKKVMKKQMKRQLAEELEAEGDGLDSELDGIVDEVLSEEF